MFGLMRRLRRDERGQAMVMGAVTMLVICVTVMVSVSIGNGIYEKIKLQDAADAQAYSQAVKEARAYNFFAYTNRAMVVHYNAMLTVMSYVSHAIYLDATIGNAATVLQAIPVIGPVFAAVKQVINAWKQGVEVVSQVLIPVFTVMNLALWVAQEAILMATLLDLYTGPDAPAIRTTDEKAVSGYVGASSSVSLGSITNYALEWTNMKNFLHAIEDGVRSSQTFTSDLTGTMKRSKLLQANKLSDPDMAKYRLLMGNIANSAREQWTAVGKGPFLIGRRWNLDLCVVIGQVRISKVADSQIKSFAETFENNRKDQLFASDDINIRVRALCFNARFNKWKNVFRFAIRVAADNRGGFHTTGWGKSNQHHRWMGITPFVSADPSFISPHRNHFGYPCNIALVTKDMSGTKRIHELEFSYHAGEGTLQRNGILDMTWKNVGQGDTVTRLLNAGTGGMMALSVGRAIYHRPGDWKEQPNFFNPLWTARLAPIRTHWESQAIQTMVPQWGAVEQILLGPEPFNY